ncbi:phosphotransferase [Weeksellaceae bacterium KMM 9713]|uniref:Phosphotransferase n=1 Tax=Profundicola chukchiensis TaxID=2961959 RepID=A0A9X4N035_9FLAO|nr:phosphotransferase [Profundicola chukchiensis]MDG4946097.1 phosphotransferase [Profundicola chukchiensis]
MSKINDFLLSFNPGYSDLVQLAESGSGRSYYRFKAEDKTYVLTESEDISENESFFYLSELFQNLNGLVPKVLKINSNKDLYIQEDLGDISLLELKLKDDTNTSSLYEQAVKKLAHLQIGAHQVIDYNQVYGFSSFDKILVLRDLFYFKDYFLDLINLDYSQTELLQEFDQIAEAIVQTHYRFFMFRDFQGRNILIKDNKTYFIDYQDGMEGPIAYDLVSLLWQAKANLTIEEKDSLYSIYTSELKKLLPNRFNSSEFKQDYHICLLIRLLQVVGAYGKLGFIQNKTHFRDSLALGIENLNQIAEMGIIDKFPTLKNICSSLNLTHIPKNNI